MKKNIYISESEFLKEIYEKAEKAGKINTASLRMREDKLNKKLKRAVKKQEKLELSLLSARNTDDWLEVRYKKGNVDYGIFCIKEELELLEVYKKNRGME